MTFLAQGTELVLASHNSGKVRELTELLAPLGLQISSSADLSVGDVEETGQTYADNALIKARHVCRASGRPALSDDSGVAVAALDGAPGVHTARWGGVERDFDRAMKRVQDGLRQRGVTDRSATYHCALAVCWPSGQERVFEDARAGVLVWPPRGKLGSGFEPMFLPHGYALTYGEMGPWLKHRVNARAGAMRRLVALLTNRG